MNGYNLGCGPGGGDSAEQVFQAAGLAFSDGDRLTQARAGEDGVRGVRRGSRSRGEEAGLWDREGGQQSCYLWLYCPLAVLRPELSQEEEKPAKEKCELSEGCQREV